MEKQPNIWGFCSYVTKSADRITKGFVSVNNLDRHNEHSPPEAFNIERYLANPIVKYNHEYWIDENGNKKVVGKALDLFIAEVIEKDDKHFGIRDVKSGKVKDEILKNDFPEILPGDRGLWTKTYYTVDEVWRQINEVGMRGYSWGGMARFGVVKIGDEERKVILDVDLYEYSAVTTPANPKALFVVGKSNDLLDVPSIKRQYRELVVVGFMFSKAVFKDHKQIREWMSFHNVNPKHKANYTETDLYYIYPLNKKINLQDLVVGKLLTIEYDRGVQAILDKNKIKAKGYVIGDLKMSDRSNVVKSEEKEKAGNIVPFKKFPLADVKTKWSFEAKDGNAILKKGGWQLYKDCHTWFDSSLGAVPEKRYAYKLPHHKEIDGTIKTVYRGCVAAWVVNSGGRGGVDIPESDREGVYDHLEKHIKEFDKPVPDRKMTHEELMKFVEQEWGVTKDEVEEYIKTLQVEIEGGADMGVKEIEKEKIEPAVYAQIETPEGEVEYVKGGENLPEREVEKAEVKEDKEQEIDEQEEKSDASEENVEFHLTKEYVDGIVEKAMGKLDEIANAIKSVEELIERALSKDGEEESGEESGEKQVEDEIEETGEAAVEEQASKDKEQVKDVSEKERALLDEISKLKEKLASLEKIEKKIEAMSKVVPKEEEHSDEKNVVQKSSVIDDEQLFKDAIPWGI